MTPLTRELLLKKIPNQPLPDKGKSRRNHAAWSIGNLVCASGRTTLLEPGAERPARAVEPRNQELESDREDVGEIGGLLERDRCRKRF